MCDRWLNSFQFFLDDMGYAPTIQHTIDRFPDNRGNYEPNNCRWATKEQQVRNVTNNVLITFKGETLILKDWCKKLNISYTHVCDEIKNHGFTFDRCVEKRMIDAI